MAQLKAEIAIDRIRDSEFYENELDAYREEKDLFSDDELSDAYKGARNFAEWDYEQKHQIAKENNY